jgi:hypothetical protein
MALRSRGTDPDHDLEQLDHVLRDAAGTGYVFQNPILVVASYEGDAYDARAFLLTCDLVAQGIIRFEGGVRDAAGNGSGLLSVDLRTLPLRPPLASGAVCDPAELAERCPAGTACQLQSGGGFACTANVGAPTLLTARVIRLSPTVIRVAVSGTDPDADGEAVALRFLSADGVDLTSAATGGASELVAGLVGLASGTMAFSGAVDLTFPAPVEAWELPTPGGPRTVGRVEVRAVDALGNRSGPLQSDLPAWPRSGAGERCDLLGLGAYCEEALLCKPDAAGEGECAVAELAMRELVAAPVANLADFGGAPGPGYLLFMAAETDAVGSVGSTLLAFDVVRHSASVPEESLFYPLIDGTGALTALGQQEVRIVALAEASPERSETHFDVRAMTLDGQSTAPLRAVVVGRRLDTQGCDPTLASSVCELGTSCVAGEGGVEGGVCRAGEAPVMVTLTAVRPRLSEVMVEVGGADAHGDVVGFRARLLDVAGREFFPNASLFFVGMSGFTYAFDEGGRVFFETSFLEGEPAGPALGRLVFELGNAAAQAALEADLEGLAEVEITLLDSAGLESEPLRASVLRAVGEAGCDPTSGDPAGAFPAGPPYVPCRPGLVCSGNVCE